MGGGVGGHVECFSRVHGKGFIYMELGKSFERKWSSKEGWSLTRVVINQLLRS